MSTQPVLRPSGNKGEKESLLVFAAVIGFILFIYLSLFLATAISGGGPSGGPGDLLKIRAWIEAFSGGIKPWAIVGGSGVIQGLFWLVLIVLWGVGLLAVYWVRIFLLGGTVHHSGKRRTHSNPFPDEIHFASMQEIKQLWKAGSSKNRFALRGIFLGKKGDRFGNEHILRADGETSVLVIGPTGSGKSSGLIVPNVLQHNGPVVVTSTKYELIRLTAGWRSKLGPVWIYDPTGELEKTNGISSIQYSPLPNCRTAEQAIMTAKWFAQGLKSKNSGGANDWEHWAQKCWNIAAPCLYVAANNGLDMKWVREMIFTGDFAKVGKMLEETIMEGEDKQMMRELVMAVLKIEAKEKSSAFSVTQRIFNPFWNHKVVYNSATNQIDARRLLTEKGTLYLQTPAQKPEEVAPLFVAILETILVEAKTMAKGDAAERIPYPLLLALDELANVCPIEDLAHIASEGRSRGVLLLSILQDFSQLERIYGDKEARTILNNHPAKLALPGITDPSTAELVCKLVGSGPATSVSISSSQGQSGGSKTMSAQEKPLMTPDKLNQMLEGTALLMHRGMQPALINQLAFYEDARLLAMTQTPYLPIFSRVSNSNDEEFQDVLPEHQLNLNLGWLGKLYAKALGLVGR